MERLSDEFRGYAVLRTIGAEPTKLLDRCSAEQIDFWGAFPEDDFAITFCTRLKDAEKIVGFSDKCSCETEIVENHGAPIFMKRLNKRYVLWLFPLALIMLLIASSFFIWKIEITGNETVSDTEILNALEDSGVYIGSFWPKFTSDNIRSRVLVKIPELKWISVSVFGSRAVVEVRERTDIPKVLNEKEAVKIIAEQSGIIDKVNVYRGYALIKKGQTAAKDDKLIDGAVPSTFGETEIVHAEGSVIARTWYDICAVIPMNYSKKEYTGKSSNRNALIIGDNRINFYSSSRIFDTNCDNIISKKNLGIKGLFELPIILVNERSEEYTLTEWSFPEDTAKSVLKELLDEELRSQIGEKGEIVNVDFTFSVIKGYGVGTLRAECRQDIAEEKAMSTEEINTAKTAKEEQKTR